MGTEVGPRSSVSIQLDLTTIPELQAFCEILSKTEMVPKAYKGHPDDILVAMLHGQEVGLPHLQALQSIAVVNGIPSIYGDAALAMVRSSGKLEDFDEWIEVDGVRQEGSFPILKDADEGRRIVAFCKSKRLGMSRERITTYSVDDAKRAKLWEKKGASGFETPWCTVPQRMLMWRARGWNLRDQFGDVLKGLAIYEEAMDIEATKGSDGVYRPALPAPESDANKASLAEAQAKLKAEREKGQEDGLDRKTGEAVQDTPTLSQDAPAPKTKITFREACDRLNLSESVKEIAAVMNEADGLDLTKDERSKLIATKDQAIKELSKKKK